MKLFHCEEVESADGLEEVDDCLVKHFELHFPSNLDGEELPPSFSYTFAESTSSRRATVGTKVFYTINPTILSTGKFPGPRQCSHELPFRPFSTLPTIERTTKEVPFLPSSLLGSSSPADFIRRKISSHSEAYHLAILLPDLLWHGQTDTVKIIARSAGGTGSESQNYQIWLQDVFITLQSVITDRTNGRIVRELSYVSVSPATQLPLDGSPVTLMNNFGLQSFLADDLHVPDFTVDRPFLQYKHQLDVLALVKDLARGKMVDKKCSFPVKVLPRVVRPTERSEDEIMNDPPPPYEG